jgi:kynurenine formamidase
MKFPKKIDGELRSVWLSHALSVQTPAYGGGSGFKYSKDKSLEKGDSCNASRLAFSSHLGTHVDAPFHFVDSGKTVDEYSPSSWIFEKPLVISCVMNKSELLRTSDLDIPPHVVTEETDLLLIKTGFGKNRANENYWKCNPGISFELAQSILEKFPGVHALGIDTISISSFKHREEGRKTHRLLLRSGIRIFEDVDLSQVNAGDNLRCVIALPLRFEKADGAPCSIIGMLDS